jgi:hypothetical protein
LHILANMHRPPPEGRLCEEHGKTQKPVIVYRRVFYNLPHQVKFLNQTSVKMWEETHFKKCKCCTVDYNYILCQKFINFILENIFC